MLLLLLSFFAGILTILAPCVLPLLPVILGASVEDPTQKNRPYIIIAALMVSVIIFSLLIKGSTLLIGVDPIVWKSISGGILILFGLVTLFPDLWKYLSTKMGLRGKSNEQLGKNSQKSGKLGAVMVGMSLGPVFTSCSPTYAVILAVILPVNIFTGLTNLVAYALGLGLVLLGIALLGQKFVGALRFASDPKGWFKKLLAFLFLFIGIAIIMGWDKGFEAFLIQSGYIDTSSFEQSLLDSIEH